MQKKVIVVRDNLSLLKTMQVKVDMEKGAKKTFLGYSVSMLIKSSDSI